MKIDPETEISKIIDVTEINHENSLKMIAK